MSIPLLLLNDYFDTLYINYFYVYYLLVWYGVTDWSLQPDLQAPILPLVS